MAIYRLGRLPQHDDNNLKFKLFMATPVVRRTIYWSLFSNPADQGNTGTCVGQGGRHRLLSAPVTYRPLLLPSAEFFYLESTKRDIWHNGQPDVSLQDGTSVLALMKALKDLGYTDRYEWIFDVETLIDYVCSQGPVIVGTEWSYSMFEPDEHGFLRWTEGSPVAGGHCWLIIGWDNAHGRFRMVNSWGTNWGQRGRAWVEPALMSALLAREGDAVVPHEIKKAA